MWGHRAAIHSTTGNSMDVSRAAIGRSLNSTDVLNEHAAPQFDRGTLEV